MQALQRSGGNQTRAGTLLGLNRDQIRYRIEKFWPHHSTVVSRAEPAGQDDASRTHCGAAAAH